MSFFLFFNTGPTNTILANVTHPLLRAPGFALNILVIHLLGDAVSPANQWGPCIADRIPTWTWRLRRLMSVTVLIGGVLWLWGALYVLERDTAWHPASKRLALVKL